MSPLWINIYSPDNNTKLMSWKTEHLKSRGGSRFAATSKMERFVIIVNGWKPLTGIIKRSILDVAAALDSPLLKSNLLVFYSNYFSQNFAVHNCHKIGNNVLPKRWCLILMEYLLDNTFLKTTFYPSNLHAWLLFTKTWTLEEWHAIWKLQWTGFFCRNYYLDLAIKAHPGIFSHLR